MNLSGLDTKSSNLKGLKFGIIGGSGLCSFSELKIISKIKPETKYGLPSDDILICENNNQLIAFLPRHGSKHLLPPHRIPYKANLMALKMIGVEYIIGTCIAGSLKKEITPGSLVIPDQFVNLTWGRDDSSKSDESFVHLPMGEPYCGHLRQKIINTTEECNCLTLPRGTVAVIQGPRFSTIAESRWLSTNGWDIVNMTQYPECYFARELGICYASIAAITDYDVGLQENLVMNPRRMDAILEIFKMGIQKMKLLLLAFIRQSVGELSCKCAPTMLKAYYEGSL